MLKQRLIFGALGIVLALAVLLFCSVTFISVCVGIISLIGMYEFFKVTGLIKKKTPALYLGFGFAIVIFALSIFAGEFLKEHLMLIISAYILVLMATMVFFHNNLSFSDAAISFLGSAYISIFFLHIIFIRQSDFGSLNIWLIFISAWATDSFAYFAGRALGKHKLCPKISPKKTVEGAIGGTLGCIICICLYAFLCGKYNNLDINYVSAVIFAVLTAVFSQLGDLAASCIKREYGVKDYGNLIPGHGGILDRFDSTLLISPLVYYFTLYFPIIIK
jgi:phosphatidate cytidylyltransferase